MRRWTLLVIGGLALLAVRPAAQQGDPIKLAIDELGAANLHSLKFSAIGANFSVGQSPSPREPWPRVTVKSYDAAINYDAAAMQVDMLREQGPIPPRGGGQPFTGQQRIIQAIVGNDAWNVPFAPPPPPPAGTPPPVPFAPPPPPVGQPPQAQPAAVVERRLQIWLTPHGFLKAAVANNATTRRVANGTEVSFTVGGTHKVAGLINTRNQVERAETWIDNPVLGDMLVEAVYRDYEKFGNVSLPTHIVQAQGGHPALELFVSSAQPNAAVEIAVPDGVRGATPPPVRVESARIAEGVYYFTGGSHHSVAIEMRDHVVLIEAPQDEARSVAVIAKVKETIPNKPVRFVVNTHHHFDHAGGLRTLVDEGATIVTHEMNRAYYETVWAAPRTLNPDRLARSGKKAAFQTFTDQYVLTDGARTVEVHRIANSPHHEGFALVYLPAEKILIEGDAYTPGAAPPAAAAGTPPAAALPPPGPPPAVSPATVNLYENILRLKLDVSQIAALHGPRLATMEDLARASGRATS